MLTCLTIPFRLCISPPAPLAELLLSLLTKAFPANKLAVLRGVVRSEFVGEQDAADCWSVGYNYGQNVCEVLITVVGCALHIPIERAIARTWNV